MDLETLKQRSPTLATVTAAPTKALFPRLGSYTRIREAMQEAAGHAEEPTYRGPKDRRNTSYQRHDNLVTTQSTTCRSKFFQELPAITRVLSTAYTTP